MRNKQHEYILKAFIESNIPIIIRRDSPNLMAIDAVIGGYCTQLIKRARAIELSSNHIISETDKAAFGELINHSKGVEKNELLIYYRLVILAEAILIQYRQERT